ncbi:nuclear transport factor 2 family protein [Flagellimonas sp.]|uniref:nuclear transport factor 2 family protein n=1 Tax=Flagellimonas sp. TaxID=2058762 RepID=UPI003B5B6277
MSKIMSTYQNIRLSQIALPIVIILVAFGLFGCEAKPHNLSKKQEKELVSSIEQFNTAFANSDVTVISSMITENYMHTNGTSEAIDKETWLKYIRKRNQEIESGVLVINNYKMGQLKIEFHASAAIATGKVNSSYTKEGVTRENEFRVTHLWVYEKGAWKRAGFHDGKIK